MKVDLLVRFNSNIVFVPLNDMTFCAVNACMNCYIFVWPNLVGFMRNGKCRLLLMIRLKVDDELGVSLLFVACMNKNKTQMICRLLDGFQENSGGESFGQ